MDYWVYEDDPTNRVSIHKAACRRCKEGQRKKGSRLPDNRWHGPFGTEQEAIKMALETGRRHAKGCWFCCGVWEDWAMNIRSRYNADRLLREAKI